MQKSSSYIQQKSEIVGRQVLPFQVEHLCSGVFHKTNVLIGKVGVFFNVKFPLRNVYDDNEDAMIPEMHPRGPGQTLMEGIL